MTQKKFNVWEGVYSDWDSAPQDSDAFNDDVWLNKITAVAEKNLELYRQSAIPSAVSTSRDYILPVVGAMAQRPEEALRVIDFGGGLAVSYFSLAGSIVGELDFYIVENRDVCLRGSELFSGINNLHFCYALSDLPSYVNRVDIFHMGSSFQYINNIKRFIDEISEYCPRYLVMSDVLAGDIDNFVTIQNYYDKKIRVRFHNIKDLLKVFEDVGFKLLYRSNFTAPILGMDGDLPMNNFEKKYRLKNSCQLLFEYTS